MNRTALIFAIWKDFRNGFEHAEVLIVDDQTYTSKPRSFKHTKKECQLSRLSFILSAFNKVIEDSLRRLSAQRSYRELDIAPAVIDLELHGKALKGTEGYERRKTVHYSYSGYTLLCRYAGV